VGAKALEIERGLSSGRMLWTRPRSVKDDWVVPQFEICCAESAKQAQMSEAGTNPDVPRAWSEQPLLAISGLKPLRNIN
jgi:1,2-phenylacetyl-CoA epoxidase PaaB subunit